MEENTETTQEPETDASADLPKGLDVESIEGFFVDQGNLIEAQIKAEESSHISCSVCTAITGFLKSLLVMIEQSLKTVDEMRTNEKPSVAILVFLQRDLAWYTMARESLKNLLQAGHKPEIVMKAHPELIITKSQRREFKSGKNKRQIAKASRRKNRR